MGKWSIPAMGEYTEADGLVKIPCTSDHLFTGQKEGVDAVYATGDGKVELVVFENHTLAHVKSSLGYPAYYPVKPVQADCPVKAVLMDLDGTTVKSEEFWIDIIRQSVQSLLREKNFAFEAEDIPFVSGHSVSEHLQYCVSKYCPGKTLEDARAYYFEHTRREMDAILKHGKKGAFTPADGVKDFLLWMKGRGIKIGLVTSGLYEKAYPEILSAFRELGLGDPAEFYDSIITAGSRLGQGQAGTLGELEAKPHPWLYAESAAVGLGTAESGAVIGIEDSGAGVCSVRLAGYFTVGIAGGNILQSGTKAFCNSYCDTFFGIKRLIKERG